MRKSNAFIFFLIMYISLVQFSCINLKHCNSQHNVVTIAIDTNGCFINDYKVPKTLCLPLDTIKQLFGRSYNEVVPEINNYKVPDSNNAFLYPCERNGYHGICFNYVDPEASKGIKSNIQLTICDNQITPQTTYDQIISDSLIIKTLKPRIDNDEGKKLLFDGSFGYLTMNFFSDGKISGISYLW